MNELKSQIREFRIFRKMLIKGLARYEANPTITAIEAFNGVYKEVLPDDVYEALWAAADAGTVAGQLSEVVETLNYIRSRWKPNGR